LPNGSGKKDRVTLELEGRIEGRIDREKEGATRILKIDASRKSHAAQILDQRGRGVAWPNRERKRKGSREDLSNIQGRR